MPFLSASGMSPYNKIRGGALGPAAVPFAFGNALQFDGVNDYVSFTSQIDLSGAFTYSIWMKMASYDDYVSTSAFGNNYHFNNQNSVTMRFNLGALSSFSFPLVALNVWENYVLTRDASFNMKLYRNGVESTTGSQVNSGVLRVGSLGNYPTGTLPIDGTLDEVGILGGTEATLTQIADLYNSGNGANFTTVMGSSDLNYHLDESGTATTAVDSSGNGNDGTLNNFPASGMWVAHLPYSGADADANAYINAGQIVDLTEIAAIEQMFLDLKGTGSTTNNSNLYNDLIAFYPISPTSLAAASVNAINPGTYNIIWNNMVAGDLTADGIQGNNSSKYGDTQIPMNTLRGVGNSFGCNVHTPGTINSRNYMGAYNSGSLFYGVFKSSADVRAYSASATAFVSLSGDANLAGNIVVDRALSTGFSAYVDGLSDGGAAASEPSVTATNPNIFLLGEGRSSGLSRPTDARINIAIIANSLSLNQHKDYQDSIAKYLLNR
tara:strand:- start:941 stop:2419 length:1479 start_codon:yes stop_codon:yes gene_type:complete